MKLEIKEVYVVDGKEYGSIYEARMAKNNISNFISDESNQKKQNFSMIKIYDVDVSNLNFHKKVFENVDLLKIVQLRQELSNDDYRFVLPTYSEIVHLEKLNLLPDWMVPSEYWTSTRFLYNTYISYDSKYKRFNDIHVQYKRNAFFLIKENKPDSWFRDPPLPNSIDELILSQEKQRGYIVHSY